MYNLPNLWEVWEDAQSVSDWGGGWGCGTGTGWLETGIISRQRNRGTQDLGDLKEYWGGILDFVQVCNEMQCNLI